MPLLDFDLDSAASLTSALDAIVADMRRGSMAVEPTVIEGSSGDVDRLLAAALAMGLDEQVASHVESVAEMLSEGHPGAWIGDQPVGAQAARALADCDVRYLTLYAEFLNLVDIQRYTSAGGHVEAMLDAYGLCPETMYLLIHWCAGIRAPDMTDVFARICDQHLVLEWLEETGQRQEFINIVACDLADADQEALPVGADTASLLAGKSRGARELHAFTDALCSERQDIVEMIWNVAFSEYCRATQADDDEIDDE